MRINYDVKPMVVRIHAFRTERFIYTLTFRIERFKYLKCRNIYGDKMVVNYKFNKGPVDEFNKGSVDEIKVKLPKPTERFEGFVYFSENGVELTRNSEPEKDGNYLFFLKDTTIDYTPVARITGKLEETDDGVILKIIQIDQLPEMRNKLILALSKVPDLPIRDVLIKHFNISNYELGRAEERRRNPDPKGYM